MGPTSLIIFTRINNKNEKIPHLSLHSNRIKNKPLRRNLKLQSLKRISPAMLTSSEVK